MGEPIRRIYLLGLRGTGKSTVAPLVAQHLAWNWCDMDAELEQRYGQSVREMFGTLGEAGFRQRESSLLREIATWDKVVVATGGGVVLTEENRQLLRSNGICIWLRARVPVLVARLQNDPRSPSLRPTLTGLPLAEELSLLLAQREPFYQSCAHFSVDTDFLTPATVANFIVEHLSHLSRPLTEG
ncbi:MAG: shikimate kinase [Gemmatales bacterium]|nr:shikimate kinase [Gemmatales bacterium]MDW7993541.1 shikimate kinase [Gemmatales bacterium]